jgi:competence protein ComEC
MPAHSPTHDAASDAPPTPYRPLLWVAAATAAGIAADKLLLDLRLVCPAACWWILAALAVALSFRMRRRPAWAASLCLVAAACLGGAWHDVRWRLVAENDFARYVDEEPQPGCVEGVLVEPIRVVPAAGRSPLRAVPSMPRSEATLRVERIRDGRDWRPITGLARLRVAGQLAGPIVGDRLRVFARMARQPAVLNPGQYDWAAAERAQGRGGELYSTDPACVTVIEPAPWWSPGAALDRCRQWCERRLEACVGPQAAPLALAIMLGKRDRLDEETSDAWVNAGAVHFLVVSGSNIAMLAGVVWQLSRWAGLSARAQRWFMLAAVLAYAGVVGPQPPVVRATILAVAMIAALAAARPASAGNLLGAAALAVMAWNPCELFRGGTQLSFLSVAALAALQRVWIARPQSDPLDRLLAETASWPRKAAARLRGSAAALLAASTAVWIVGAPLVAYHFQTVTPAAVLATPILWPLVSVALAASFLALSVGWLIPPVAVACGAVCAKCLLLAERSVEAVQSLPYSHVASGGPRVWWLLVFYAAVGLAAAIPALRPRRSLAAASLIAWSAIGYGSYGAWRLPSGELRCTVLSVGHGTSVVLELPGGQTLLYDAGSLGTPEQATGVVAGFLWQRGVARIDQLLLSHADVDHYNAVPGLVERFPVGAVYFSPMMFDPVATGGRLTAPNYLRDFLAAHRTPTREVWLGDRLATLDPRVQIEVLHPPREGVLGRDNANSVLLVVEYAGRRILLPGDLESPGIERVMADPPLDCDVLLAPHHGSEQSDPPGFAAWCTPEHVVMSGRRPTRPLSSVASYRRAGARVWHTAEAGATTFRIDADGALTAESFVREETTQ